MKINKTYLAYLIGCISLIMVHTVESNHGLNLGPTEYFDEMFLIDENDKFILYWKHNQTDIIFEVHMKTFGWLEFGLSHSGLLQYSDVIVAWLNSDGTGHFSDRHIIEKMPLVDKIQNWYPILFERKNGFTILKFTRKLIICDHMPQEEIDIDILPNNNFLIYAYGNSFKTNENNQKDIDLEDSKKGSFTLDLIGMSEKFNLFECMNPIYSEFQPESTGFYLNSVELVPNFYKLFWNVTKELFVAEIHIRSNGWFCFGFSSNSFVDNGSDLVFGWYSNSKPHLIDTTIFDKQILKDSIQNWNLIYSYELNNYLVFKISRDIYLCNPDDLPIYNGSPYVIFDYGSEQISEKSHITINTENLKITQLFVLNNQIENENTYTTPQNSETLEFSFKNLILPNIANYYFYCKSYKIELEEKRHIYKWQVILPSKNRMNIEYLILNECDSNYIGEPDIIPGDCFANHVKAKYCRNAAFVWSKGSDEIQYFPSNTGYPIGGDTDYRYIVVEFHYSNLYEPLSYIDALTLRLFITNDLRENELGTLKLGAESDPIGIMIPPKQDSFKIRSLCSNNCIKSKLDGTNINIIKSMYRTHSAGKHISTIIIRENQNIDYLDLNTYYNSSYQNNYNLIPNVIITENDSLLTECIYSTIDREYFTYGGLNVRNEVCQQYLLYYPRINHFKYCDSFPDINQQLKLILDLKEKESINIDLGSYGTSNYEPKSSSVLNKIYSGYEVLKSLYVTSDEIALKFKDMYETSSYYSICQKNFDLSILNEITQHESSESNSNSIHNQIKNFPLKCKANMSSGNSLRNLKTNNRKKEFLVLTSHAQRIHFLIFNLAICSFLTIFSSLFC